MNVLNPDFLALFERFGGWIVVLIVVRWMMVRLDRQSTQTDKLIDGFQETVAQFRRFESEEIDTHLKIMTALKQITESMSQVHANLLVLQMTKGDKGD